MPTLADLSFIDIYVRLDEADISLYRCHDDKESLQNQVVPSEYNETIAGFITAVKERLGDDPEASVTYDGVRCRLSRQEMADGSVWACARQIKTKLPELDKLGFAPHIYQHLHGLGRRDGLILISGSTGQGKTTTGVALLADYLRSYGGAAITIEDPVEYLMKGRHGDSAHCFQVEIRSDDEWATAIKRSMRWTPRYIYVGEIRTPKAAEQMLRAATTGHTVITTVHAGAPDEALMGLLFFAEQAMGARAKDVLAAGLTGLVHQHMRGTGPYVRYLFTEENSPGDPVRSLIRESKIGMISTYIDRVAARLANQPVHNKTSSPPPPSSALPPLKKP